MDRACYYVMLTRGVGVRPRIFAKAWNIDPQTSTVAEASVERVAVRTIDPFVSEVIQLAVGIGVSLVSSALYDLIVGLLRDMDVDRRIRIIRVTRPDGLSVEQVTIEESGERPQLLLIRRRPSRRRAHGARSRRKHVR